MAGRAGGAGRRARRSRQARRSGPAAGPTRRVRPRDLRRARARRFRLAWGTAVSRWLALLLGAGFTVVLLVVAAVEADRDRHLLAADRTARATVLAHDGKEDRVAFTTDGGRRVEAVTGTYSGTQVGDVITVRYHPADPASYVIDTRVHFWPFVLPVIVLIGAGWLAVVSWLSWRGGWP
ncbi:DUF3592 domain-containing protein [Micromonospora sp. PLK6-60]|uniref:DUF3592 domain-containing protein n=1 Tax=Micromonospora sp. PLK6-60 TaxID=2873383 RepID=UPI001CA60EB6|nr:DUF3592 domain-containing protein [Micromonospora sp. PLK6-60]MBY8871759.1 DUF3592 domain-containing protein [Micromonospora sp. PLK6-60]